MVRLELPQKLRPPPVRHSLLEQDLRLLWRARDSSRPTDRNDPMIESALMLVLCAMPLLAQVQRTATLGDRVRLMAPEAGYRRLTGEVIATVLDVLPFASCVYSYGYT